MIYVLFILTAALILYTLHRLRLVVAREEQQAQDLLSKPFPTVSDPDPDSKSHNKTTEAMPKNYRRLCKRHNTANKAPIMSPEDYGYVRANKRH